MDNSTATMITILIIVIVWGIWYFGFTEKHYQKFCKELGYDDGTFTECYRIEGNKRIVQPIHCEDIPKPFCQIEVMEGYND